MILILDCGLLTIPDCVLFRKNTEMPNNIEIQRQRFEDYKNFCKQNALLPTPDSMSTFLEIEKKLKERGEI